MSSSSDSSLVPIVNLVAFLTVLLLIIFPFNGSFPDEIDRPEKKINTVDKNVNSNTLLQCNHNILLPITFPLPFVIIGDVGELGSVFPEVQPLKKASGSEVIVRERLNFFLKCKKWANF